MFLQMDRLGVFILRHGYPLLYSLDSHPHINMCFTFKEEMCRPAAKRVTGSLLSHTCSLLHSEVIETSLRDNIMRMCFSSSTRLFELLITMKSAFRSGDRIRNPGSWFCFVSFHSKIWFTGRLVVFSVFQPSASLFKLSVSIVHNTAM